jgi:hypothetical protein
VFFASLSSLFTIPSAILYFPTRSLLPESRLWLITPFHFYTLHPSDGT